MPKPKDYRVAPGHDRCDGCFSRRDDGMGCKLNDFGADEGYRPNMLCGDYASRSGAQRYENDDKPAQTLELNPEGFIKKDAPAERAFSAKISSVEIMRVGTWNGNKFTKDDLAKMVDAFALAGFSPPVKVGHVKAEDAPAWGWVENLRLEGDVLVADFRDVPDELVELIREKRYDAVSAEVWFDLKVDKIKLPVVLKAVALLGAHPPAVSGLKPVSASLAAFSAGAESVFLQLTPDEPKDPGMPTPDNTPAQPGAEDAAVRLAELQRQNEELNRRLADAEKLAANGGGDMALRLQRLEEQNQELQRQTAETAELRRQDRIDQLARRCKVPAFHGHFRALADMVTRAEAPKAVTFKRDADEAAAATDPAKVLEDLADRINKRVDVLFSEQVRGSDMAGEARAELMGEPQDAGLALAQMTDELMVKNPSLSYEQARTQVLANPNNAELKRRWSAAGR
jgi:hypothetical protein